MAGPRPGCRGVVKNLHVLCSEEVLDDFGHIKEGQDHLLHPGGLALGLDQAWSPLLEALHGLLLGLLDVVGPSRFVHSDYLLQEGLPLHLELPVKELATADPLMLLFVGQ